MKTFVITYALFFLATQNSFAQAASTPPCGNVWGSTADRKAIDQAMLSGTAQDVIVAIQRAKQTRGAQVGCSEAVYSYKPTNGTPIEVKTQQTEWQQIHAPQIARYNETCPRAARNWGLPALGGYYANRAGYAVDLTALARIADVLEATQYKAAHAPINRVAGAFGYLSAAAEDACADKTDIAGKPLFQILAEMCQRIPARCETYTAGRFAGQRFVIADVDPAINIDGGMAYDHGIAGVMMIEAALQQTDAKLKQKYKAAALLAGEWAIAEPPVRNHNYTAKLVWLLAELYEWTGDAKYRAAMLDKLHRNLLPGVLMDMDNNGEVDDMPQQSFRALTTVAQRPGRYWDGHNTRPVYQAMNAFALVEAYVALRERGNRDDAARVKPYVRATLDNLAWEINHLGVPSSGYTMVPYALLLGLYKIAAAEKQPQPEWAKAFTAYWNARTQETLREQAHIAGLYLLAQSGQRYVPLHRRK